MRRPYKEIVAVAALLAALLYCSLSYAAAGDYEKGVAFLRAGKADEALKLLEPLAADKPSDPYLEYHIGLAAYRLGLFDKSFDAFLKAKEIAGANAESELGLGAAFCNLAVGCYRGKDLTLAEKSLAESLSLDPSDGDARYYMGLVRMEERRYGEALNEFERAASLKGRDRKFSLAVSNARGAAYYKQENFTQARARFAGSLEIDPANVEALYYIGLISYQEDGYAAAKPYFDRIASSGTAGEGKEALFTTFFNMGIDFQNRDKAAHAAEMFERAIKVKPDDPDAHFYRGYNLSALERYEEAADEFSAALKLKPDIPKARAELEVAGKFASEAAVKDARGMMGRGEYYMALKRFEKASILDPAAPGPKKGMKDARAALDNDTRERTAAIRTLIEKGEYVKARGNLAVLQKANPDFTGTAPLKASLEEKLAGALKEYLARAKEAESADALGEASAWYGKALLADPANSRAAESQKAVGRTISDERHRTRAALDEGNLVAARKGFERLTKYLPDDPEARKGLQDVRERIADEVARCIDSARDALTADELDKARGLCDKALTLSPDSQAAAVTQRKIAARGLEIERAREAERAREQAARAADAEKAKQAPLSDSAADDVRRLYLVGVEHYTKGELKEAIASWREVLRLDPENEKATSSIAKAEEKLKEAR